MESVTSNSAVHFALSHQLRKAAQTELLKQYPVIDADGIYRECAAAFEALSDLLGEDTYFFKQAVPGLFDAALFAYTNLFLDEHYVFKEQRVRDDIKKLDNLVKHRRRLLEQYFP